jgi:hypothetical protein
MTYRSAILLLTPAILGILVGYLLGGRLIGLTTLRLRAPWLLWVATAVQIAQYHAKPVRAFLEDRIGLPMFPIVLALVLLWLGLNIRQTQLMLRVAGATILLGAVLNGAAILANGYMPYSTWAAEAAGLPATVVTPKNKPANTNTRLPFLGDIVPLPLLRKVLSPGDVLIGLGAATAIVVAMRRRPNGPDPALGEEVNDDFYDHVATRSVRNLPDSVNSHAAVHDWRASGD